MSHCLWNQDLFQVKLPYHFFERFLRVQTNIVRVELEQLVQLVEFASSADGSTPIGPRSS